MFTVDKFWDLLSAASGETVDGLTDALDSIAKDSKAKTQLYFDLVYTGAPPGNENDWYRLRNFLMDWYSAHQSIASASTQVTDPRTLPNPDLDELFRSFGYNYSTQLKGPDENPIDLKINFFLDLVNLYKRKGTPQTLMEVLQYYGVTKLNIYEFFIERSSTSSLVFEGTAVTGTTANPSKLIFDYDRLTVDDPHWLYTEQQILDLYDLNDINLPSKTPYLGVQPVASIDGAEIGILIRLVQDQYQYYLDNGVVPTANAEISELGEVVSLLELYLSILYVFNNQFNVGQVGDSFICYDGTSIVTTDIIDEFDSITVKPQTRAEILTGLEAFYDGFTREAPRNFLQNRSDAGMYLTMINPTLKSALDSSTLTDAELLFSLMKDLSAWVRIYIGYGFVNMGFIMFGLDSFFEDLKPVMNFFKPYRARLLLLELLQIDNPLFNTIIIEDSFEGVKVEFPIYDFITGNGNPCCTLEDIDTTDCCFVCLDDSTSNLYYQRETYDCGSYHDIGAVTDILQNDFFPMIYEIRHIPLICIPPDFDSTAIVFTEVIEGSMTAVTDGTSYTTIFDSTEATSFGDIMYQELTTGGFADFDEPGTFDCPTGFDEVWITVYQESSSSASSTSSSSSLPCFFQPDDAFVGADGDPPDLDRWTRVEGALTTAEINTKFSVPNFLLLYTDHSFTGQAVNITHNGVFVGDFSVQIDYFHSGTNTDQENIFNFRVKNTTNNYTFRFEPRYISTNMSMQVITNSGADNIIFTETDTKYTSGTLKFTRVGSTFTGSYLAEDGTAFVDLASWAAFGTDDVEIRLGMDGMTGLGSGDRSYYYDNFTLNSGVMECPFSSSSSSVSSSSSSVSSSSSSSATPATIFYPAVSADDGHVESAFFNSSNTEIFIGDDGIGSYSFFVRFVNVTIPQASTINSAFIRLYENTFSPANNVLSKIKFEDSDDAVAPTNATEFNALTLTTAFKDYTLPSAGGWQDATALVTIVQEVVDRGSWSSGNAMMVVFADNGSPGSEYVGVQSIDSAGGIRKMELHVDYT